MEKLMFVVLEKYELLAFIANLRCQNSNARSKIKVSFSEKHYKTKTIHRDLDQKSLVG